MDAVAFVPPYSWIGFLSFDCQYRSFVQTPSHGMIYLWRSFCNVLFGQSVLMVGSSGSFRSTCASLATTAISTWWSEDHWKLDSRQPQLQFDSTIITIT